MGYEDINDHDELRQDSVLAMLVGKRDLIGKTRPRSRDRGYPLASSSTLNRLEPGDAEKAPKSRNKRIVGDLKALDRLFVDVFIESFDQAPKEIWLDLDATDDLLHGSQEQRFYHGYYKNYCYLALYIFCGEHLLDVQLRPSNQDASAGSEAELTRIVGHIRQHWPATKIVIRADSGFCRDAILTWCENNRVDYVVGVARNDRLVQAIDRELQQARRRAYSRILPIVREKRGPGSVVWSVKPGICRKAQTRALWSPACRVSVLPHNRSMRSCIVHVATWRTA